VVVGAVAAGWLAAGTTAAALVAVAAALVAGAAAVVPSPANEKVGALDAAGAELFAIAGGAIVLTLSS
jgi:hypothetical protein